MTTGCVRDHSCVFLTWMSSPLGPLLAGATQDGVCLLEFCESKSHDEQVAAVRKRLAAPVAPGSNEPLGLLERELTEYFAGSLRRFTVPLTLAGTSFQNRVWENLCEIPYAETRSYYDLAVAVGAPKAVRAVGRANGLNRIVILIPCHRVVNKSGALGGYGGGLRRKQFLLDLERWGNARSGAACQ